MRQPAKHVGPLSAPGQKIVRTTDRSEGYEKPQTPANTPDLPCDVMRTPGTARRVGALA
jgi:hypothetical protein